MNKFLFACGNLRYNIGYSIEFTEDTMTSIFSQRSMMIALLCASCLADAHATALVGQPAPDFTLPDGDSKPVSLADYKGKFVVLEWTNDGCPFVQHYYKAGAMQALQKEYAAKGVIWLSVISSSPGKQGYVTGAQANALNQSRGAHPTDVLLDPSGKVGHLYDAKTTPDMFIVDPRGMVVYAGAIDSVPSTDSADIAHATPYVKLALDQALAGRPIDSPTTLPYGCSIKY